MIEKLTITRVHISDKDRDGNPFKVNTRNGVKTVKRIGIQTVEYKDEWLNGTIWTDNSPLNNLKEGDEVNAEVSEYNGKLQFKIPSAEDLLRLKVDDIDKRLRIVEDNQRKQFEGGQIYPPEGTINPEDVPF